MTYQNLLSTASNDVWFEIVVILIAFLVCLACFAFAELVKRYYLALKFLERMDARFHEQLKHPIISKHVIQCHASKLYEDAKPNFWNLVFSTKPLQDIYWFSEEDYTTFFTAPFSHEELKAQKSNSPLQRL